MNKKMTPQEEADFFKHIVHEILYMAARYADGRSTFTPLIVNQIIDKLKEKGYEKQLLNGIEYAKDGMFGTWDSEIQSFVRIED